MRILHTSDWHLGRTLAGHDRSAEHAAFLDELVALSHEVDAVMVTGDVFDTANPPIAAEEMFFDALARLGDAGRRPVVVIAGNHDAPDRIVMSRSVSSVHGAFLFGRPGDVCATRDTPTIRVRERGPSRLLLDLPAGPLAIAALPFPSEARLRALIAPDLADEADAQRRYSARVGAAFAALVDGAQAPVVALSHLHVRGAVLGHSERTLVGGAWQVDPTDLPATAAYVALGHVHHPQQVTANAWYAGAPLAFRMDERDTPHQHLIVDLARTGPAVTPIPVRAGRRLVRLAVPDLDAVAHEVAALGDAFVEIVVPAPPTTEQMVRMRRLPLAVVRIRVEGGDATPTAPSSRRTLPADELFRAFVRSQRGTEPEEALVALFVELCDEAEAEA